MRRWRARPRTVLSTGARRARASKNTRTSPGASSSTGITRARIRAATGDAGWASRSRSRRQPAASVQSTAVRTPVAPSRSSVSVTSRSWCETRATAGMAGNSRTKRATTGNSSPRHRCTDRTRASTRFRRAVCSASRRESAWSVVKQPSPTASTRGRSGGGRTVQTVTMQADDSVTSSTSGQAVPARVSTGADRRSRPQPHVNVEGR